MALSPVPMVSCASVAEPPARPGVAQNPGGVRPGLIRGHAAGPVDRSPARELPTGHHTGFDEASGAPLLMGVAVNRRRRLTSAPTA